MKSSTVDDSSQNNVTLIKCKQTLCYYYRLLSLLFLYTGDRILIYYSFDYAFDCTFRRPIVRDEDHHHHQSDDPLIRLDRRSQERWKLDSQEDIIR